MMTTTKPLLELTAADLMSRDLIAIPQQMSIRAAARLLSKAQVSGAPVVDNQGRCVGILSATDLVRWVDREGVAPRRSFNPSNGVCTEWQALDVECLPADEVSRHMTTDLVKAERYTPIGELARSMLDAHIHRVLITDAAGRPVGIVSSTDILAAVARLDHRLTAGRR
jgi:CBS-domain-containing membrane protein